jgi:hypothetical protein
MSALNLTILYINSKVVILARIQYLVSNMSRLEQA